MGEHLIRKDGTPKEPVAECQLLTNYNVHNGLTYARGEHKTCIGEGCNAKLLTGNTTGLCVRHYRQSRSAEKPKCTECKEPIGPNNKSGTCLPCLKKAMPPCSKCEGPLDIRNTTGVCKPCRTNRKK